MDNLLLKKLQIKPGFTVKVVDAPENAAAIFGEIPADMTIKYGDDSSFDVLITFSTLKEQLDSQIRNHLNKLNPKTIFWVFMPKKSSKVYSDLDMMSSWQELAVYGLNPCASAAVNEIWTALRLKFINDIKPSGLRNDHIRHNEFADYIDVENKIVKLPEDLAKGLHEYPVALQYFNGLAYSHKKEYVLWILTAKQEKTRLNRVEKAIEMLLNNKKNPSVK
ncbi:YdeI/OmpD-associated family protein [Pedobacter rhodius]|uniref:YdeI/OmpD-associated family protein n=1 Tax=Pedobacter rhodius TaxID=3004098 RepID=A0ABT4KV48_9SPHI|nr:YdeI/OmpD-associated family protein [Pedobacter sp. SJ11]MCZ4222795.1 YdeI/OmpD-associated family protein [Pedobacter sp. SJ11]